MSDFPISVKNVTAGATSSIQSVLGNLRSFVDNADALDGGLSEGDYYHNSTSNVVARVIAP